MDVDINKENDSWPQLLQDMTIDYRQLVSFIDDAKRCIHAQLNARTKTAALF